MLKWKGPSLLTVQLKEHDQTCDLGIDPGWFNGKKQGKRTWETLTQQSTKKIEMCYSTIQVQPLVVRLQATPMTPVSSGSDGPVPHCATPTVLFSARTNIT